MEALPADALPGRSLARELQRQINTGLDAFKFCSQFRRIDGEPFTRCAPLKVRCVRATSPVAPMSIR